MRIVCLTIFICFSSTVLPAQKKGEAYAPGELLVKFSKDAKRSVIDRTNAQLGSKVIEDLGDQGWHRIRISRGTDVKSAIKAYSGQPGIESVQPNFYYHLQATPNDPQWGVSGLYGLPKVSAPQAWDITTGSSAVVVANIDTGIRYTHEDLAANMWTNPGEINGNGIDDDGNGFADDYFGYDFFYNDPDPLDENGHGTHTSGTIGAVGNNGLGVVGVNWNVKIMAIKIYNNSGFGTTSAMLINAYNYIRMMKERGVNIRVTNNSYAGCDEACGYDQATKDSLDAIGDAGILNVFAAGNNGWNNDIVPSPAFPAAYTSPSVLTVAASTNTDTKASFSNWGAESVDLAAPGLAILSTTRGTDSSYGTLSGTSMAAPHVTGAAALLSASDPTLSPASLKATLMNTVDPLPGWGLTPIKTGGRLNVFAALQNPTVCTFGLSTSDIHPRTKGGSYSINVSAGQNCDFSVKSNFNWVHIETPEAMSGTGSVRIWVGVNRAVNRTGIVKIAGQAVTITQSRDGIF